MKTMTLEQAIEIVTDYAMTQYNPATMGNSDELRQAAEILRNMAEEPVENEKMLKRNFCPHCNEPHAYGHTYCTKCKKCMYGHYRPIKGHVKKTYTTTRILEIVDVVSDVKFEEVD